MNVVDRLNEELLQQAFGGMHDVKDNLAKYQYMAFMYSQIENSIAVLSDMKANKSYIYNGKIAVQFGLDGDCLSDEINSIWEDTIFRRIHPDDLLDKHMLELQFFSMLKAIPVNERSNYHVLSKIRMMDGTGGYRFVQHRMFYVCNMANGSLWLTLCLYNFVYDEPALGNASHSVIVNSVTGRVLQPDSQKYDEILSVREKEILQLIRQGKLSKEIAESLYISVNTVSRHRQNILEKLRVSNSLEACRIAERMRLI